ncbi:menaquinone via futalosine step 1 [Campylobacter sp. LR264d]|uniref:MqnA/MqnD/SBP family protein n=1 Tax=Campylobacter sp. LR264d TaxID=2593544 RepID=UPI001239067F|nr:MqnA/MqnD/SBP family protein [Campylobacter sp. LR264d]KAA6231305.1 menaquinone via futalosine step 1 [Campylobacter sp. LR264d]
MLFGKIDYINLLPLHIYLKKYPLPNGIKRAMEYKKGVPSKLNKDLFYKRIDAGVISSIQSAKKKYKYLDIGICANKRVMSVLVKKNTQNLQDPSSASSNALAKILKVQGQVVIGDKALKYYIENEKAYIDLCSVWFEKTGLPFVFGRFSCIKHKIFYERIFKNYQHSQKTKLKIPYYILEKYAKTRQISVKNIKFYLQNIIYHKISFKEKRALKLFFKMYKFTNF